MLVGIVLLVAGLLKITDVQGMVVAINAYQIFPLNVIDVLAWVIPATEIIIGILLILGMFTRFAAIIASLMFISFICGISWAWSQGYSIDCGCFGGGGQIAPDQTQYVSEILRDLGLLAASLWLVVRPASTLSIDQWLLAPITISDDQDSTNDSPDDQEALA